MGALTPTSTMSKTIKIPEDADTAHTQSLSLHHDHVTSPRGMFRIFNRLPQSALRFVEMKKLSSFTNSDFNVKKMLVYHLINFETRGSVDSFALTAALIAHNSRLCVSCLSSDIKAL